MVDIKFLSTSTVTYASRSGWRGPTERGFAWVLSETSCTLEGTETSVVGVLFLRARARVASLTTIVYHSLPTDGAKSALVLSKVVEDDVG